jgi:hypothetical protein
MSRPLAPRNDVEEFSMNRLLPRLLPLSLVLTALGGCSAPASLALLVDPPSGAAPASVEVRAYSRTRLLASQKIEKPALPGAIALTSVPTDADQLRIVVLGRDQADVVKSLAFTEVATPISARTQLPLTLDTTFQDGDGDGVPDAVDGCPTVADADQDNAAGFGNSPGDACASLAPPDMAGAGADMGPPPPPCPVNALCDSFDAKIDTAVWSIGCQGTPAGCAAIDAKKAYRGAGSLHVRLDQTPAQLLEYANVTEIRTVPATDIFARAFVWVPSTNGGEPTAVFTAGQNGEPYNAVTLQLEQGGFSMYSGIQGKEKYVAAAGGFPKDQWFCLEWELKVGNPGSAKMWVGGVQQTAPALSGDTTSSPVLGQLSFGMTVQAMASAVPARDMWFDEVVVSSKRVGCQ